MIEVMTYAEAKDKGIDLGDWVIMSVWDGRVRVGETFTTFEAAKRVATELGRDWVVVGQVRPE